MKGLDKVTIFLTAVVFLAWGCSTFFDKLAANKLGTKASLLFVISSLPSLLILLFLLLYGYKPWGLDKTGILLLTISTTLNFIALAAYYLVFVKAELSWAVVATALYPSLAVILAFIFLHESITAYRVIGIILAIVALVFLSI